ncbi:MAG: hypothetical protein WC100_16850 [Sterolibacterium sp.]
MTGLTRQATMVALAVAIQQGELIAVLFTDDCEPQYMPANRMAAVMLNPRLKAVMGNDSVTEPARAQIDAQRSKVLH